MHVMEDLRKVSRADLDFVPHHIHITDTTVIITTNKHVFYVMCETGTIIRYDTVTALEAIPYNDGYIVQCDDETTSFVKVTGTQNDIRHIRPKPPKDGERKRYIMVPEYTDENVMVCRGATPGGKVDITDEHDIITHAYGESISFYTVISVSDEAHTLFSKSADEILEMALRSEHSQSEPFEMAGEGPSKDVFCFPDEKSDDMVIDPEHKPSGMLGSQRLFTKYCEDTFAGGKHYPPSQANRDRICDSPTM